MREALSIKNELDSLKESQRRLRSRRKSASRSSLNRTGSPFSKDSPHIAEALPIRKSVEDWYNEGDVSVSSTGSDIKRRLEANLGNETRPRSNQFSASNPTYEDVSPIANHENRAPRPPKAYQLNTPLQFRPPLNPVWENPQGFPVDESPEDLHVSSGGFAAPCWVSRNPHLASIYDPSRLGEIQLPPLFRSPITVSSSALVNWSIPPPVLYGLGRAKR